MKSVFPRLQSLEMLIIFCPTSTGFHLQFTSLRGFHKGGAMSSSVDRQLRELEEKIQQVEQRERQVNQKLSEFNSFIQNRQR
jgi:hypothetical protein